MDFFVVEPLPQPFIAVGRSLTQDSIDRHAAQLPEKIGNYIASSLGRGKFTSITKFSAYEEITILINLSISKVFRYN